jgi:hypothetical protein
MPLILLDPTPSGQIGDRDAFLGRLGFPTILDDLKESVGDALQTVSAGVVPGERSARPFTLSLPVHGSRDDPDKLVAGLRMGRQVRGLIENPDVRLQGLYLRLDFDSELNGWLLIGAADLEYSDGGPSLGEFKLTFSDCYRIGSRRTHRPARRVDLADRRLSTTPRDTLESIFSTDFAAVAAVARTYLPVDALQPVGYGGVPVAPAAVPTLRGDLGLLTGRPDGEAIVFDQLEANFGKADVLVLDRGLAPSPTYTPAGDVDPQGNYAWEEVYGTDQPLTDGDVPVLDNAESDGLHWPRRDGLEWPHFASVVVRC